MFANHEHELLSDRRGFCTVCFKVLQPDQFHCICKECNYDICMECLTEDKVQIPQNSFISFQKLNEAIEMIEYIKQDNDIQPSSTIFHDCLVHSYPTFHLYDEQSGNPNFEIQATRSYIDSRGNKILFFSSQQANKIIKTCKNSVDKFLSDHSVRLSMHHCYPILKSCHQHIKMDNADLIARSFVAGFFIGFTLYAGYGIDQAYFSPLFFNALAGARFVNFISKTAKNSHFGCILRLDENSHIIPADENDHLIEIVPDHNVIIDWSKIQSLPIVPSIINEIKEMYPNYLLRNDHQKLNMIFSLADYLEEGISTMLNNPLFNNSDDKKIINFVDNSIKSRKMFLRIKPKPFTILHTTVLNIYQADFKDEYHAFLSKEQIRNILPFINADIRESLTELQDNGEAFQYDYQNQKDSVLFIKSLILQKEVQIAEFYNDMTQRIWCTTKLLFRSLLIFIFKDYSKINNFICADENEQNKHLDEISNFNEKHKDVIENIVKKSIKKKIIPDFFSSKLADMTSELAKLKHIHNIIKLSGEMQRRLNDDFGFFHIDLKIVPCRDCVQKYEISVIV